VTFPVYYPDTPDLPLPAGHRFPAQKYRLLRTYISDHGILESSQLVASPAASEAELCRAHETPYVKTIIDGSVSGDIQRAIGIPWSPILVARSLATVGGTLAAARAALKDSVSGQLAGGTHHAHRARGSGFCVFNDCAVAILALLAEGAIARAAVLDLDVHQGDGNAAIFADERCVFTASVHGENNYPFAKCASDLDIGLPDGAGDEAYLAACVQALQAVTAFAPDIVFYIAGVDPLWCDRLGRLNVSSEGLQVRDRLVLSTCRDASVPVVILIGGGYAEPIIETVRAYAATFATAREVF
jgi:acetoin utilization deacetylase AcuC-like enzyme